MEELAPDTIRVKHKLIPQVPFIIINTTDFDPEMHTMYEEEKVQPPQNTNQTTEAPPPEIPTTEEPPTTTKRPSTKN